MGGGTRGGSRALPRRDARFRFTGRAAAPEPPEGGDGVWSHGTSDGSGALRAGRRGSEMLDVWWPEALRAGRWGLELRDAWQHQSPPA
jgi:hypothetical protein